MLTRLTPVRKDLIYEGITTKSDILSLFVLSSERTWFTKGLRRVQYTPFAPVFHVRKDLIYEGITTGSSEPMPSGPLQESERTWFTKGLRHRNILLNLSLISGQKGPDLRRDYDDKAWIIRPSGSVRKDLIYEGITTVIPGFDWKIVCVRKDLIYEGITTGIRQVRLPFSLGQKGPDLRRDYDMICFDLW